ncbi:hypothetical protein DO73_3051 [Burkholderia pseudomallei]|nr:hypothetical protein DO73_3051 [Burkholderia pseudomallei]
MSAQAAAGTMAAGASASATGSAGCVALAEAAAPSSTDAKIVSCVASGIGAFSAATISADSRAIICTSFIVRPCVNSSMRLSVSAPASAPDSAPIA